MGPQHMELIMFLLINAISFLGIACGVSLAYMAKEELNQGKRFFIALQLVLMSLIIFFIFYEKSNISLISSLIFLFGFPSGSLIIYEKIKFKRINLRTFIIYLAIYLSLFFMLLFSFLSL